MSNNYSEDLELQREFEGFWKEFHILTNDPNGAFYNRQVYRGHSSDSYKLLPSIARSDKHNTPHFLTYERQVMADFQRRATPFISRKNRPEASIDWVIMAQHYGVSTRLLDWTTNPMVALFFAVEKNDDHDGVLYICSEAQIVDEPEFIDYEKAKFLPEWELEFNDNPFGPRGLKRYGELIFIRPQYLDRRYENQATVLSCPADPFFEQSALAEYLIPIAKEIKPFIRRYLSQIGFSYSFIYPGIEGAAKDINSVW